MMSVIETMAVTAAAGLGAAAAVTLAPGGPGEWARKKIAAAKPGQAGAVARMLACPLCVTFWAAACVSLVTASRGDAIGAVSGVLGAVGAYAASVGWRPRDCGCGGKQAGAPSAAGPGNPAAVRLRRRIEAARAAKEAASTGQ